MAPITQETTPANASSTRRSDAVGMEIPVVVHASRYSTGARGTAKALPSVHEETRTVIVFPQGAVVRLSATMVQGELVVLTNQQSGADVLCKVANVKAQPGIQNYVDLEFTQRAPGFWGDCFGSGAQRVEATAAPEAAAAAVPLPPKEAAPAPSQAQTQQVRTPEPPVVMQRKPPAVRPIVSPALASPVSPKRSEVVASPPAVTAAVKLPVPSAAAAEPAAPVAAPPVTSSASFEIADAPAPASAREFGRGLGGSLLAGTASSAAAPRPVELGSADAASSSGSKKMLLVGVAAVVVLGLIGGGFLLYRQGRSSAQARAAAQTVQPAGPQTTAGSVPSGDGSMVTVSAEPVVVSAVTENPQASQSPNGSKPANAPSDDSRRTSIPIEQLSRPMAKSATDAGSMEAPQLSAEANQPVLGGGLVAGRDLASLPGSAPAAPGMGGGHIDPPKLASSPSAIYPAVARNSNVEGVVVVDALVDASGTVTQAQAVSGPTLLRQAAADSVRTWKYQPAKLNGQPIAVHTQVSVDFHLNAAATSSGAPANSIAATSSLPPSAAPAVAPVAPVAGPIQAPKLVASPPPVYPADARSSNVEGVVVLDLLVDETGKVTQVKVVSGPPLLQPAAVEAVHTWKYQPARQNGQPVAQHAQVSINFRLR